MKQIYYAMVQPVLQYGILAWGGTYITHINQISLLQKSILKIMHSLNRRSPSSEVFNIAKVFTIRQLFAKVLLLHYHKYPNIISSPRNPRYLTRFILEGNAVNPRPRLVLTTHSPHYILYMLHRRLAINMKTPMMYSRPMFKKLTISWILQQGSSIEENIFSSYI